MTAAAWIREFGLMLGWREGAKGSRIRVGAAGVAGTMPASETVSAQGDRLPVLAGRTLIARLEVDSLIAGIRAHSHASAENFQRHYAPVIDRALEFAQLLPASESHHHAQPGGMALHSLETALHALKRRQGLMLPPGAPTETQQRAQHRWTYAVFLAALLHDMGKAAHDLRIAYDSAAQVERGVESAGRLAARARGHELPGRLSPTPPRAATPRTGAFPWSCCRSSCRHRCWDGWPKRERCCRSWPSTCVANAATARWRNWSGRAIANRFGAIS